MVGGVAFLYTKPKRYPIVPVLRAVGYFFIFACVKGADRFFKVHPKISYGVPL